MDEIFVKPIDTYKREINPVGHYIEQNTFLLMRKTGKSKEECRKFIVDYIKNKKKDTINNPTVRFFERQSNGDREVKELKLTEYISEVVNNGEILAPTMTTYLRPEKKKSLIVKVLDKNAKLRKIAKKKMFAAEANKDMAEYAIQDSIQNTKKGTSNSVSGLFAAMGSVLQNKSAHSTLTSTTRSMGSFGNCTNERVLSGSRLYMSPLITYSNLLSIASRTDTAQVRRTVEKFKLVYPTTADVMECIRHSTMLYWDGYTEHKKIESLVECLTKEEKAAFVYSGDLYHLRKLNENQIRDFVTRMSKKVTGVTVTKAREVIEKTDEGILNMAHVICMDEAKGLGKDLDKFEANGVLHTVAATCVNIANTLREYEDLIRTFLVTDHLPVNIAYAPEMTRRVIPVSDTDSTCFSTQEWIEWYYDGVCRLDTLGLAVGASVAFVTTETIKHVLAKFSANMNTPKETMRTLAMKNEYLWFAMGLTPITKHYFALTAAREGNIFDKPKAEIKGVHLKNSSSPVYINSVGEEMMIGSLKELIESGCIDAKRRIKDAADVERKIITSLKNSETEFLRSAKIKDKKAYKKPETESPYRNHQFWIDIFEDKYGKIMSPPYSVVKIPTRLRNKTMIKSWIAGIEDRSMAERLTAYFERTGRTSFNTMYVSEDYVLSYGIPKEIQAVLDIKRVVLDLTGIYRIILESLGQFFKPTLLICEHGY